MYTKDELKIVEYIENGNPKSIDDKDKKIEILKKAVLNKYKKKK